VFKARPGPVAPETIYRKQIRPVPVQGADAMDAIFQIAVKARYSLSCSALAGGGLMACCQAHELVGVAGFEPAASSSRTKRAAKLRHTPPTAYGV
jgi:hypothetical protein